MPKKKTLRTAAYYRVSTLDQALTVEGSLENQRTKVENWRKKQELDGLDVQITDYCDEGRSGGEGKHRPQYEAMLRAMDRGEVDVVVVNELSRLSRSLRDFLSFMDLCSASNVRFFSINDSFDTSSDWGAFAAKLLMMLAEMERQNTARRTREVMLNRKRLGKFTGNHFPTGLKSDPRAETNKMWAGHLVKDEKTFPVVEAVFSAFEEAGSLRGAVAALNEKGVKDPARVSQKSKTKYAPKPFSVTRVRQILTNRAYVGKVRVPVDYELREGKRVTTAWDEVDAAWPAYIEPIRWHDVQDQLQRNELARGNTRKGTRRDKGKYPLSGIATCGYTGRPMSGASTTKPNGKVHRRYWVQLPKGQVRPKETASINADELEQAVFTRFKQLAMDADLLAKAEAQARKERKGRIAQAERKIKGWEKELQKIEGEQANIRETIKALRPGKVKSAMLKDLQTEYSELETRKAALREDVKLRRSELPLSAADRRHLSMKLRQLTKAFDHLDKGGQSELMAIFVTRLEVYNDRILLGLRNAPLEMIPIGGPPKKTDGGPGRSPDRRRVCVVSGSPGRTRTSDRVINSHLLYQLSYRGIVFAGAFCCSARPLFSECLKGSQPPVWGESGGIWACAGALFEARISAMISPISLRTWGERRW